VQDEVEKALRRLNWQGSSLLAAGRTDTGVHASGQVIAFDLDWQHSVDELKLALNAYLPADIAVRKVQVAMSGFHPRRDALARQYHYHVFFQDTRDPLRERYAWRVWPSVNLPVLQQATVALNGKHDFAAFGTPPRTGGSTVRTVFQATWFPKVDGWVFTVVADAFLYHMVRRMVHLLIEIGQEKFPPEIITGLFQQSESGAKVPLVQGLAPARGLALVAVTYPLEGVG
jgi:tRNA pseudouridine38-40 synthase